ncbi:cytochrome c oxidase assembly protein [Roseibium polysiphoniae]|uniref:Cytochrome c oxidase assembly protein CtaG n=1 Tax=Roseibium polysiphoniae TaxID=2571221 RepID=A0ABR9CGB2_9HYPH|nr:cytochrome c oxidase assembly protein [Roseibium polysiphoniae]MBD8878016.1 cytochrome c oxidase assembly protein [Roseibium polysiphoniae]
MSDDRSQDDKAMRRNRTVGLACAGLFVTMIGAAYAAVPLYNLFCQVTGFGGTTQVAEAASDLVIDRPITIRFDGNVNHTLNWKFKPVQRSVTMKMGESAQIAYTATNTGADLSVGTSVFNVTPNEAGAYFNKLECFCFTEQALAPGESVEMPVVFFIDPDMDKDPELKHVKEITLSYTFFPVDEPEQPVAARAVQPAAETKL